MREWMGASRYCYNRAIDYRKAEQPCWDWMVVRRCFMPYLPRWTDAIPFQIKGIAFKEAFETVQRCIKVWKRTGVWAEPKFRSRKEPKQSCFIPKSAVSQDGIYPTILGKIRFAETLPDEIGDCRLVSYGGRWYLSVPHRVKRAIAESQGGRFVSLDPGVRTFITWYSAESCGKIGAHDFGRIQRLCLGARRFRRVRVVGCVRRRIGCAGRFAI